MMASSTRFADLASRSIQGVLAVTAAGGTVWAVQAALTTPGLVRTPAFALVAVCCMATAGAAAFSATSYRRTALWAALSLVGHALSLQMIDSGPAVVYPHFRPAVSVMERADWAAAAGLLGYGLAVIVGMAAARHRIGPWITMRIGGVRSGVILAAWAVIAASPLRDLGGYALEAALMTCLGLVGLGAIVLAVISVPDEGLDFLAEGVERVLGGKGETGPQLDPVALSASAFVAVVSTVLTVWIWERQPHISDEISFLFQARYFADGALTAPGVPIPELFEAYQIDCEIDRCLSVLQPGWPGVLAAGVVLGVPWLVNPLLAGINTFLFFVVVRELYGRRMARGTVLLLAVSPWHLFLGMSFMNHQAMLLGALVAVAGTTLAIRRGQVWWAMLAGMGAGFTSLMRPMDGVIVAVGSGLPLLLAGKLRRRLAGAVLFGVGTAALGSANLVYNAALMGNPLEFPVTAYVNQLWGEGTNNLGFGPDRGVYPLWAQIDAFPGHSPFQAVVNGVMNVTAIHFDLFGWATGSLISILLLFAWARLKRNDWLLVAWILTIVGFYSLYWFASGPDFAARYWFLAIVPIVILAARGVQELVSGSSRDAAGLVKARCGLALALLAAQSILVFVPWRATDKYFRYFATGPLIANAVESGLLPPAVYLVQGRNQPDYAAAMLYNAPDLATGERVFAYDSLPDAADRLRLAYPDRKLLWLGGASVSGGAYRVYASPPADRLVRPDGP